ncbi:MAG: hypothetical protein QOF77_2378 [Solirubrobacteraceae bacterium]|jgi:uncharacterized protein (DUF427 family)|nr:hypothetical protein [Solirubrobacteraceae bacterium]
MEDVWSYPRPPALVACERRARVVFAGVTVADSTSALRVLETSHPPVIYIPPQDIALDLLAANPTRASVCEWKGRADYLDLTVGRRSERAVAWTYRRPAERYAALRDHIAFYPSRMDACWLGKELVRSQEGDFYGGWITDDLKGPFKGAPGTLRW